MAEICTCTSMELTAPAVKLWPTPGVDMYIHGTHCSMANHPGEATCISTMSRRVRQKVREIGFWLQVNEMSFKICGKFATSVYTGKVLLDVTNNAIMYIYAKVLDPKYNRCRYRINQY